MGPASPGGSRTTKSDLGASGEGREPAQSVGDLVRPVRLRETAARQVEEQEVDRSAGQQAARDRQPFVEGLGGDHHEPLEAHAARDGLDGIERPGEVQPGHHRAGHLGLGHEPERQGGPSARAVATDGDAGGSRQASWSQDGIEAREPGGDDPVVGAGRGP